MINRESRRLRVLQVGMTRNLGGIETYLIEQFRHLDKSKIDYDFVNITGEYSICYEDEILASGSKILRLFPDIKTHCSTIGSGLIYCYKIKAFMM